MPTTRRAFVNDLFLTQWDDGNEHHDHKMGRFIRPQRRVTVAKFTNPSFRLKVPFTVVSRPDSIYRCRHLCSLASQIPEKLVLIIEPYPATTNAQVS